MSSPGVPDPFLQLRTITTILTTTAELSLPNQIPVVANLLYSSAVLKHALSSQPRTALAEEAGVLVSKFKSKVSALLQSRVSQARWSGVILAKCAVETSDEALIKWGGSWVKPMVGLLNRPEPAATTVAVVRTVTRIFTALSKETPAFTRESVTPYLPGFFGALLSAVECGEDRVVNTALVGLRETITAHPVTFRPFSAKTKTAVLKLLSTGGPQEKVAREVFVTLHLCGTGGSRRNQDGGKGKANAVAIEWETLFRSTLCEVHTVLDALLTPIIEDERSALTPGQGSVMGLGPLEDDHSAQTERALMLLRLLGTFFTTPTTAQPSIPIDAVLDVARRIFSASAQSSAHNPSVEKKLRDVLFVTLPSLHTAALNLLETIARSIKHLLIPFVAEILEQTGYIFAEDFWNTETRVAAYTLTDVLLQLSGPALSKPTAEALNPILSALCDDLVAPSGFHGSTVVTTAVAPLLATSLSKLRADLLRADTRAKLERTVILTGDKEGLLAAVMFPRSTEPSLISHMVSAGIGIAQEALIRPRMPVIWTGPTREEVEAERERIKAEKEDEARMQETMERERMVVEEEREMEQGRRGSKRLRAEESELVDTPRPTIPTVPVVPPAMMDYTPTNPVTLNAENAGAGLNGKTSMSEKAHGNGISTDPISSHTSWTAPSAPEKPKSDGFATGAFLPKTNTPAAAPEARPREVVSLDDSDSEMEEVTIDPGESSGSDDDE